MDKERKNLLYEHTLDIYGLLEERSRHITEINISEFGIIKFTSTCSEYFRGLFGIIFQLFMYYVFIFWLQNEIWTNYDQLPFKCKVRSKDK